MINVNGSLITWICSINTVEPLSHGHIVGRIVLAMAKSIGGTWFEFVAQRRFIPQSVLWEVPL